MMVTHDVGLKFFADRIIWMRDGKIQRVETVSSKRQAEMMAELERDLQVLDVGNVTGIQTAKKKRKPKFHRFASTDIRHPYDYQTNKEYDPGTQTN